MQLKGTSKEFVEDMREYFTMGHAERVPLTEVDSPGGGVYFLPIHAVHKEHSTISKLQVVIDA